MKKVFLILLCSIAVLLLYCLSSTNYQDQPIQNTPEQVSRKLHSLYGVDFEYADSVSNSEGDVIHQFYSCIDRNLFVSASYRYAGDPFYIFPFVRRVVFQDDLVEQIRVYCIHRTFGSNKVHLLGDKNEVDDIVDLIVSCMKDIEYAFYTYNIDKSLNTIYISIDFLLDDGDVVSLEFSDSSRDKIESKVLHALY